MRFLSTILAVLVLFLSCVPCADAAVVPVNGDTSQTQVVHTADHNNHEHKGIDLCSPFCVCACCATFSVVAAPMILPERVAAPEVSEYAQRPSRAPVSMPLDVWEPPQLA